MPIPNRTRNKNGMFRKLRSDKGHPRNKKLIETLVNPAMVTGVCPFHNPGKEAYCLIGDCLYNTDIECPIFLKYIEISGKEWCGCGDELRSDEDIMTKTCWICRSVGRMHENTSTPK